MSKKVMFPYLHNYSRRILLLNDLSLFLFLVLQVLLFGSLTAFDTLQWCVCCPRCVVLHAKIYLQCCRFCSADS